MHTRTIYLFLYALLTTACISTRPGIVRFTQPAPETYSAKALQELLQSNRNPSVVLRVPEAAVNPAEQDLPPLNSAYNAIEKQLIKSGFAVRDRGLFNALLASSENANYQGIAQRTDTDIIIELVGIDFDLRYRTNTFSGQQNGKEYKLAPGASIELPGASVEFRIVVVAQNEIAGLYRFDYAPCQQGCKYRVSNTGALYRDDSSTPIEVQPYETISVDALAEFMTTSTQELIRELRG